MSPGPPNVVLAGNNAPAVAVLDLLLEAVPAAQILCLSPPGPPRHGWQISLHRAAAARGVACLTPDDVNAAPVVAAVGEHRPGLLLSVYYTQLFRTGLLEAVDGPRLNFHPSLLPRHRGTAPIIHAIAEGDGLTGLSVHHIDVGVDTGRLVWQRPLPIHPDDTGLGLHAKLGRMVAAAAAELLCGWLRDGTVPDAFDQEGEPSVHRLGDPPLNALRLAEDSRERVRNVVRALAPPLPGAHVELAGRPRVLAAAWLHDDVPAARPGTVEDLGDGTLVLHAADGALRAEVAA